MSAYVTLHSAFNTRHYSFRAIFWQEAYVFTHKRMIFQFSSVYSHDDTRSSSSDIQRKNICLLQLLLTWNSSALHTKSCDIIHFSMAPPTKRQTGAFHCQFTIRYILTWEAFFTLGGICELSSIPHNVSYNCALLLSFFISSIYYFTHLYLFSTYTIWYYKEFDCFPFFLSQDDAHKEWTILAFSILLTDSVFRIINDVFFLPWTRMVSVFPVSLFGCVRQPALHTLQEVWLKCLLPALLCVAPNDTPRG